MSGPATEPRDDAVACAAQPPGEGIEVTDGRASMVGSLPVQRALPLRARRTVGPWCFADLAGPVSEVGSGGIGPHPHIGLQTVTWLLEGELLHLDSLGSEQAIRPGQLNLMTAGQGVAHAEERRGGGTLHAVQLWIAQPEATRHGPPAFEHHDDLPEADLAAGRATVLVGDLAGAASPARCDTSHVGADLRLDGRVDLPLDPAFEHAILVCDGAMTVEGIAVTTGQLAYVSPGRDVITVEADASARALLLGGEPFTDEVVMWWNYVARTRQEVSEAHAAWSNRDARFGVVTSSLPPVDVGPPPWPSGL